MYCSYILYRSEFIAVTNMSSICMQWKVCVTESVLQSPAEKIDSVLYNSSKAQRILILFQFYRTIDVDVAGK
jgi:uncharacterized protein (DUF486 family)